jgi:hypothetical protein
MKNFFSNPYKVFTATLILVAILILVKTLRIEFFLGSNIKGIISCFKNFRGEFSLSSCHMSYGTLSNIFVTVIGIVILGIFFFALFKFLLKKD